LVDADRGVVELGEAPPAGERLRPWARHDLPLAAVGAGYGGPPVLTGADGAVYRWAPGTVPRRTWTADVPPEELIGNWCRTLFGM
jgi:hypothetical protein